MERKFGNATPEERKELLKANAYSISTEEIRKEYTQDELESMKTEFTEESIALAKKEKEKADLTAVLNGEIKILKTNSKKTLAAIARGGEDVEVELFAFDDQDRGTMDFYDESGEFIRSRKLKPEERQTKLYSLTGTDN